MSSRRSLEQRMMGSTPPRFFFFFFFSNLPILRCIHTSVFYYLFFWPNFAPPRPKNNPPKKKKKKSAKGFYWEKTCKISHILRMNTWKLAIFSQWVLGGRQNKAWFKTFLLSCLCFSQIWLIHLLDDRQFTYLTKLKEKPWFTHGNRCFF